MSDELPATIIYPAAFRESLPAGFDGALHWEYLNEVLRPYRGIECADIDSMTEINGVFLSIETKNVGKAIPTGQELRTKALLDTGLVTHFDIWGKEIPRRWRMRTWSDRKGVINEGEDCRADIAAKVAQWAKWADRLQPIERLYRALSAAWRIAPAVTRENFAKDILQPSLGDFDSTPLAQWVLERVRQLKGE